MSGKVAIEIQQTKPFSCAGEEVFLNLARSYEYLLQGLAELLREFELSTTQYNMLRILRGAGEAGLSCTEAARRMVSHDPDVTRLFDRLAGKGLVARTRSAEDRRVVVISITPFGLNLLAQIDQPLLDLHAEQIRDFQEEELTQLVDLLERLRP